MIRYISTRGPGAPQSFTDVLLAGMAPDGGLYIPESWPQISADDLRAMRGLSYAEIAFKVIQPFVGDDIPADDLKALIDDAYGPETFGHRAVASLTQMDRNRWVMELFHGPTLSFKDYAMQLLGRMFDYVLERRGERITIVGATSGDTGSAAIEACRHCKNIDIFIMYPDGRTSNVQRKQMTSVDAPNVHALSIEGNFDDCQALVKDMFADEDFRSEVGLSAINSINWCRIMAQIVYYVAAAVSLGAPDRKVSFAVPTGNFGNIFAANCARHMGVPIDTLMIATNKNDILTRFFEHGVMSADGVEKSLSPSMDIEVSSNFERYLCDLMGRDHDKLKAHMEEFKNTGRMDIDNDLMKQAREAFKAGRCSDDETMVMMRRHLDETGYLLDPHTAVGVKVASDIKGLNPQEPVVMLACAHPAKFPTAVTQAIGDAPEKPERLAAVMDKEEKFTILPNDYGDVSNFVRNKRTK